jgi:LDH2 family malate/lactate/ureidoglycolate dehydrogenase
MGKLISSAASRERTTSAEFVVDFVDHDEKVIADVRAARSDRSELPDGVTIDGEGKLTRVWPEAIVRHVGSSASRGYVSKAS